MDAESTYGGHQNPLNAEGDHGCINMMSAANVVTHTKYYGPSQPNMGEEPAPPESPLHIDKLEAIPHIPKGVLKRLGHNPNARSSQYYFIVEDLGQNPCGMSALEFLWTCPS